MKKRQNKTMGFVVDKVSEDSFYENLLLGLSKVLEKSPCVSNLSLKRFPGLRQADIRFWEHNNGVILPEDLRAFYSSVNGFLYNYDFSYDYESDETNILMREGKIEINPLNQLVRTFGYETRNSGQIEQMGTKYKLTLTRDSKVFELSVVDEYAKVVLVYVQAYSIPSIWLYSSPMSFNFLANDFTTYFRMCIAHLGIPCWQYIVSKENLPEWSREIFHLIAPGVLKEDRNLIDIPKFHENNINKIDPNIFIIQNNLKIAGNERNANNIPANKVNKSKEKKVHTMPKRHISSKSSKKHFI